MKFINSTPFSDTDFLPPLISDYLAQKNSLVHLAKYPFDFFAFKNVIEDKAKDNTDRKLLVDVLKSQYADIATSDVVLKNIELLRAENTFTVAAAHQPCLFFGPLYNVYKIACTINVVNQLKQTYPDKNFIPVFWLGSEDHDVEELNHAFVNGKKIEWKNAGTGAAGRWETDSMNEVISELKIISANEEIISVLENGLKKYTTFGRFTQYFINEIFKVHGLVVIDGDNVNLKKKFSNIIKDEIFHSRANEILKSSIEFLETNYKAQAKPRDINFFYLGENFRERLVYNSATNKFEVNNTSLSFSKDEIVSEIENHPERFSPNVIYRPLYQEIILPNLAFVGGAGELSYWLELKPLFDFHKVPPPMQIMRNSVMIITSSVLKKMEKLNIGVQDFFGDVEQLINRYVQSNMNADLNLSNEKKQVEKLFDSVIQKAEATDVTLKQTASAEKQKIISSLENLEAKMRKAEKRKQGTAVNQIRSVHSAFFPENTLQERRENFIPFYTNDFISTLVETLNPFEKAVKIFSD